MSPTMPGGPAAIDVDVAALASPELAARDRAVSALESRAPRQLLAPLLERLDAMASQQHARARFAFSGAILAHQSRRIRERPRFDLDYRGPLRGALVAIGETSGLLLQVDDAAAAELDAADVAIDARGCTALELVDRLGRRWKRNRHGVVVTGEAAAAAPVSYTGPCRVRVAGLQSIRETDFAGGDRLEVSMRVAVDFEWPVRPLGPPSLQLGNDQPTALEDDDGGLWRWRCGVRLKTLAAGARSLSTRGDVMCTFAEGYRVVALDELAEGASARVGDLEIAVERLAADGCLLAVSTGGDAAKLPPAIARNLVPTTILGIDEGGDEALAKIRVMHSFAGGGAGSRVGAAFEGFTRLRGLRLRLPTGVIHQLHPVRFDAVGLP